jgi:hypothetical protein
MIWGVKERRTLQISYQVKGLGAESKKRQSLVVAFADAP